jgi:DNA-binding LytR/AlgR family response regulator
MPLMRTTQMDTDKKRNKIKSAIGVRVIRVPIKNRIMTKILIIEDERLAAEKLERMIMKLKPEWTVLGSIETVEYAVKWLNTNPSPDLILLDIQLADGISFEIFDQAEVTSPIIFTTAYDEYAIRAFKVNSIDYLLKPIDPDALNAALLKFERINTKHAPDRMKLETARQQICRGYKSRFLVKVGSNMLSVLTRDVELFFIDERLVFIRTFQGKTYDVDYSLDQLQQLVDPDQFFRINRNYLVNIDAVTKLVSYSSSRFKLELHPEFRADDLIVAREKASDFKKWMDR